MKKKGNINNLIIKPNRLPHIPKVQGVYKITDHTNSKCYIGSSLNINQRCSQYLSKGNTHPKGMDFNNITFEMLADCKYLTVEQRLQLELECITEHNTFHPNGYNKANPVFKAKMIKAKQSKPRKESKPVTNYGKKPKSYVNVIKY